MPNVMLPEEALRALQSRLEAKDAQIKKLEGALAAALEQRMSERIMGAPGSLVGVLEGSKRMRRSASWD